MNRRTTSTKSNIFLIQILLPIVATNAVAQDQKTSDGETSQAPQITEEIVVRGTAQSRYLIDKKDPITGLDLDFLENPRSVSKLPEQLFLDRKITYIEEALHNAPGVVAGDGFGGTRDDFFVRGFRRNAEYRDGFRRQTGFKTNLSNVEHIDVIRGPAAITFGQVSPGGVVNVVTKRPLEERRLAGELRYGSFKNSFGLIDWSQPVTDKLAIRLVGSIQNAESFRDFTKIDRDAIAVSARYDATDRTRVELAYEYRYEARPLDRGTFALKTPNGFQTPNELLGIPISRRFGEPFEAFDVNFHYYEARVFHNFNDRWSLSSALALEDQDANDLQARVRSVFIADANDTRISDDGFVAAGVDAGALVNELRGAVFDDPTDRVFLAKRLDGSRNRAGDTVHANFLLNGEFATGPLTHRVSIGADYRNSKIGRQFVFGAATDGTRIPFFNIASGAYVLPGNFSTDGIPIADFDNEDYGFFANSYTNITDRLGVLLGMRYSETDVFWNLPVFKFTLTRVSSGFSPQAGVTYQVTDNASIYASYSESFQPNNQMPLGAGQFKPVDPQEGEQYEIGVKAAFAGGKLEAQAAVYQLDLTNVFTGTDANFNPIFIDGQTSKGVELTFTGQPLPGMNVTTAYAYTDAKLLNGNRAAIVPEHTLNLYASYEVQRGILEGLGIGGGVFHQSDRFGNNANNFELGSYTLADASLWYIFAAPAAISDGGTIRLQLALKNILDEEYFVGTGSPGRIPLGIPRTVFGSVSFDF